MIVFIVSGLWHGANWSFVVWGGLNGLFQIIGDITKKVREGLAKRLKLDKNTASNKILKILCTFILVDFTWIFFRANSFKEAVKMIKSIFTVYNPWILFNDSLYNLGLDRKSFNLMIISIIILIIADFVKWKGKSIRKWICRQEIWFRWFFYIGAIFTVLIFGIWGPQFSESAFIYFQF